MSCQVPQKQFFVYPDFFQIISKDLSTCVLVHQCFVYSISRRPGSIERDAVFCDVLLSKLQAQRELTSVRWPLAEA